MVIAIRAACATLVLLTLGACAAPIRNVAVDGARLVTATQGVRLACAYRLGEVVDAREGGTVGGQLGANRLAVSDAAQMVRRSLEASGFAGNAGEAGRKVNIDLMQFYILHNHLTKVPVVVYRVRVEGEESAFLIRAQPASMVWNGSENEAIAGYREGLADANGKLILRLNEKCGSAAAS